MALTNAADLGLHNADPAMLMTCIAGQAAGKWNRSAWRSLA